MSKCKGSIDLAESCGRNTVCFAKCRPGAVGATLVLGNIKVSTGEGRKKSLLETGHSVLRTIKDLRKFCYR